MNEHPTNNSTDLTRQWLIPVARGVAGAIVGGLIGYFAFGFLWNKGWYAFMLPAGLVGIGFGLASQKKSIVLGIVVALIALVFGLWTEATHGPFTSDESFGYFLKTIATDSVHQYKLLLHGLSGFLAFWFARGR